MKPCTKCGVVKPLREFYKHPGGADGHRGDCKACVLEERRARYEQDGEVLRDRVRRYQSDNPEKVRETRRNVTLRRRNDDPPTD